MMSLHYLHIYKENALWSFRHVCCRWDKGPFSVLYFLHMFLYGCFHGSNATKLCSFHQPQISNFKKKKKYSSVELVVSQDRNRKKNDRHVAGFIEYGRESPTCIVVSSRTEGPIPPSPETTRKLICSKSIIESGCLRTCDKCDGEHWELNPTSDGSQKGSYCHL